MTLRETPDDLVREAAALDQMAKKFKCDWRKLGNGGKYRIDAVLHRGSEIKGFVEYKCYSRSGFCGVNLAKYMEMIHIGEETGIPVMLLYSVNGADLRYIKVWDYTWRGVEPKFQMAGGTPPGRAELPDDYEPMALFKFDEGIRIDV